jgi:hypothetical protein
MLTRATGIARELRHFRRSPSVVVGYDDTLILDCYRLARWYHQSPDVFLTMTVGEVGLHMRRTLQLANIMQREASSSEDGD